MIHTNSHYKVVCVYCDNDLAMVRGACWKGLFALMFALLIAGELHLAEG
jgi:hypothetical protein